jgi:hypothetical protein
VKSYWGERELRLAGKAWEIRHRLRRLALRENLPGTTLADVLMRKNPEQPLLGMCEERISPRSGATDPYRINI